MLKPISNLSKLENVRVSASSDYHPTLSYSCTDRNGPVQFGMVTYKLSRLDNSDHV